MSKQDEPKPREGELTVSAEGVSAKGVAYEDLRPLVQGLTGIAAPILFTIADCLSIGRGWAVERLRDVADRYEVKLHNVPRERRQLPRVEISAAVLSKAVYAEQSSDIAELFAELLTAASDSSRASAAHVAFAAIISELEPLDAKVLQLFASHGVSDRLYTLALLKELGVHLRDPEFNISVTNLRRHGLVDFAPRSHATLGWRGRQLRDPVSQSDLRKVYSFLEDSLGRRPDPSDGLVLTPFGKRFLAACTAAGAADSEH